MEYVYMIGFKQKNLITIILLAVAAISFFPGIAKSKTVYSDKNFTVSQASSRKTISSKESISFDTYERLYFYNSDLFNAIRYGVLSEKVDESLDVFFDDLGGNLGDDLEEDDMISSITTNESNNKVTINLEDYRVADDSTEVRIFKRDKDDNGKKDKDSGVKVCTLQTYVWFYDGRLILDFDSFSVSYSVIDTNKIKIYFSTSDSKIKGDLNVKAECIASINVRPELIATGFSFSFDVTLNSTSDDVISIDKVSAVDFNIYSIDINTDDMGKIKEWITDYGMEYFVEEECKNNESFEDCVSRQILKGVGKDTIIKELQTVLTDAIPDSIQKAVKRDVKKNVSGIGVNSTVKLTSFEIDRTSPNITTNWENSTTLSFDSSSCMTNLDKPDEVTRVALRVPETETDSEGHFLFPKGVIKQAAYAFLKSGIACFNLSYTEPTYSIPFTGKLFASGGLTLEKKSYEAPLYIFDNYEWYFSQNGWDPEGRMSDEDDSDTTDSSSRFPKRANVQVSNTVSRDKSSILENVFGQYKLSVSTYTEEAFLISLPVKFEATKTYMGEDLSVDMSGEMNVYFRLEPNGEEGFTFFIKKAELVNFEGSTTLSGTFGTTTVNHSDIAEDLNKSLYEKFYSSRTKWVKYYDCQFTNDPDTIKVGVWGVSSTTTENNCEEDCEYPLGSKDHNLSSYGYTLRADSMDLQDDLAIIGLNSEAESMSSDGGCTEYENNMDIINGVNTKIDQAIEMGKLAQIIQREAIREGMKQADMTQAWVQSIMQKVMDGVIIDESPNPDAEQWANFVNFVKQVSVYDSLNQATQIQTKIQNTFKSLVPVNRFQMMNSTQIQNSIQKQNIQNNNVNRNYKNTIQKVRVW